jgi:hypothetical protein
VARPELVDLVKDVPGLSGCVVSKKSAARIACAWLRRKVLQVR